MRIFLIASAVALIGGAWRLSAEQGPPARIPVEQFAALPLMEKPMLSPNGHWIATQSMAGGKTMLLIVDADHPEADPRRIPIGKPTIASIRWAGDKRLLVQLRLTQMLAGSEMAFLRLVVIDTDTGASRLLDPSSRGIYVGDVLYVDPTGSWALVAGQSAIFALPSVKRVDLASGKTAIIESARDNIWRWYADENGVVRAGVAYDTASRFTVWYRNKAGDPLRPLKGKLKDDGDATVDRLLFHGGDSWIVTDARTGRFGLYSYDLNSGSIGAAVFEHPEVDVDEVFFDPTTGNVSGVGYQDDRAQVFWVDPAMKKLQAALDQAVPGASNLPVGWSNDRTRVLVRSMSGSDPGRYFLLDRATHQMRPVVELYPDIDPDQLAMVKSVRYQTRDGLGLRAYLTLPRGRDAKGLPLIVLPHGGPFARDQSGYDPLVQFLANRGYAVLQPEFRGSTGFGKAFVARGYNEIGQRMQDDLDDGVDWLVRSGQVDPRRVCMVGLSYGGYAAMWAAIRNPDRYRCAASWAGPFDLPAMMRYDETQFAASRYFRSWRKQFSTGDELNAVSPINFATRFRIPIFIAQGEEDTTVPPKQAHKMVDDLQKAGADVTSAFYKDSKHDFGSSKDRADWLARLEAFLAKYNPA